MSTHPSRLIPRLWKSTLLSGLFAIVLGLMLSASTGISTVAASVLGGCYLLVSGLAQILIASMGSARTCARVLLFISGGVWLILAAFASWHCDDAMLLLATWISLSLLLRGVASTLYAISQSLSPRRGWNLFLGVGYVVAGIVVLALPIESVDTPVRLVGVLICVMGWLEVVSAVSNCRASQHMMGDMFGDVRMLSHDLGLMNPFARAMWRVLKIDGRPSQYRNDPRAKHPR